MGIGLVSGELLQGGAKSPNCAHDWNPNREIRTLPVTERVKFKTGETKISICSSKLNTNKIQKEKKLHSAEITYQLSVPPCRIPHRCPDRWTCRRWAMPPHSAAAVGRLAAYRAPPCDSAISAALAPRPSSPPAIWGTDPTHGWLNTKTPNIAFYIETSLTHQLDINFVSFQHHFEKEIN